VLKIRDLARKSRRSNKELKTKEISVKMDLTRGFVIKVAKKQTFMAIICCYGEKINGAKSAKSIFRPLRVCLVLDVLTSG